MLQKNYYKQMYIDNREYTVINYKNINIKYIKDVLSISHITQ